MDGGLNTFGYANQNPIRFVDPFGLETNLFNPGGPFREPLFGGPFTPEKAQQASDAVLTVVEIYGIARGASVLSRFLRCPPVPTGKVGLDTNAIIARLEGSPADVQAVVRAIAGRIANVSITSVKEFLRGGGDVNALRSILQSTGGRVGPAPSVQILKQLQQLGLKPADARVVGSAIEQAIPVLTRDKQILKKVPGIAEKF